MSITKSYNKQTGIYYAYETTYEWSDEKQKKVQHKRCVGQFDPETGEVIPNGKVGRPSVKKQKAQKPKENAGASTNAGTLINAADASKLIFRLAELEAKAEDLSEEIRDIASVVKKLASPII